MWKRIRPVSPSSFLLIWKEGILSLWYVEDLLCSGGTACWDRISCRVPFLFSCYKQNIMLHFPYTRATYCHQRVSELGVDYFRVVGGRGSKMIEELLPIVFHGEGLFCIPQYLCLSSGRNSLCFPVNLSHCWLLCVRWGILCVQDSGNLVLLTKPLRLQ